MSEKMRAVQWVGDAEFALRTVERPVCGDDDIVIKIGAAGICGGDMHAWNGALKFGSRAAVTMGHEFAGTIVEMGKNVDSYWKIGDRVVSENTGDACGHCPACASGNFVQCPDRKIIGGNFDGGFAEYTRIPGRILKMHPNCLFHIPDNLDFPEATVLEPAANAYRAVVQEGGLRPGETVVVFGAGALGLLSIQMAKIAGAANIILVAMSPDEPVRVPTAIKYGARHVIYSDRVENVAAEVAKVTDRNGVQLVIDAAGVPVVMKNAVELVSHMGRIVRIGLNGRPYNESLNPITMKSVTIYGHNGYNTECWNNCIALAAAGILDLKSLITRIQPLEEFRDGFESYKRQEATKIILVP